ncbi:hypothetical protein LVD13_04770 [Flavobacteriaceae bacterium D16]|nr:hypothetical protein [Flavobacteriaceae bacterium D16]
MYPMEVGKKTGKHITPTGTELQITLKIDAAKLYSIEQPTREEINAYCSLSDTNPPESHKEDQIEHFESRVLPGQQVRWEAKRKDSEGDFEVAIESIVYAHYKKNELDKAREENFFNAIAICSTDGQMVRAKIKEDFEPGELVNIYNLNFNIRREGKGAKCYSIDPRLKMDQ